MGIQPDGLGCCHGYWLNWFPAGLGCCCPLGLHLPGASGSNVSSCTHFRPGPHFPKVSKGWRAVTTSTRFFLTWNRFVQKKVKQIKPATTIECYLVVVLSAKLPKMSQMSKYFFGPPDHHSNFFLTILPWSWFCGDELRKALLYH